MSGLLKLKLVFCLSFCLMLFIPTTNSSQIVRANLTREKPPNILLILTDDLDLAAAKYLPRVQSLIKDRGVNFSNYVVNISLCCPARATILRGQYAHNTKIYTNRQIDGSFIHFYRQGLEKSTIATWLEKRGYKTAFLGKYLNGYPRRASKTYVPPGWETWASPIYDSGYLEYNYTLNENGRLVSYGDRPEDYSADVYTNKARQFITEAAAAERPFFLYLSYFAPHQPAIAAPRHRNLFTAATAPRTTSFNELDVTDKPEYIKNLPPLDRRQQNQIDRLYQRRLRSLQAVDEGVAATIDTLKANNQLDNTYIIFSSDNGFHLGQHRLPPNKETAYEEDIHLPLYIRGPHVPVSKTIEELVGNIDLAPTFAELAGIDLPRFVDGRSLVRLWKKNTNQNFIWRQAYLLQHRQNRQRHSTAPLIPSYQGLRTADCTYVRYENGEQELYNLKQDPQQVNNLANKVHPHIIAVYAHRLQSLINCRGKSCRRKDLKPLPNCELNKTVS